MPCCCYTLLIEMAIMWVSLWKHGDFMRSQMRIGIECSSRVSSWGSSIWVKAEWERWRERERRRQVQWECDNVNIGKRIVKDRFLVKHPLSFCFADTFPIIFGVISFKEIIFNTQREWKWTLSSAQSIDGQFFFCVDITVLCNNNNICLCR